MMDVTQVSDLDKMLGLLKEYTTLLRDTCQRELERRTRVEMRRTLAVWIGASISLGSLVYIQYQNIPAFSYTYTLVLGITVAVVLMSFLSLLSSQRQYSYDAGQVAHTLQRLTEITSQYSEHATKRISDRFELDLRLAEAEGVLKMYREIFGTDFTHRLWEQRRDQRAEPAVAKSLPRRD